MDIVGASVLSILTESLYDNPIVIFREYVQNSVDSIYKTNNYYGRCEVQIWSEDENLFFLDNGQGIERDLFEQEMVKICYSNKRKYKNLGYKGIGRLSGVPYCDNLIFINICDYKNNIAQVYTIDRKLYEQIKDSDEVSSMLFSELISVIGKKEDLDLNSTKYFDKIKKFENILNETNTGFLVVLENINAVIKNTINQDNFINKLNWLLPVDFEADLYATEQQLLFKDLTTESENILPIKSCRIYYNGIQLFRPIKSKDFRDYLCKSDFKYAVGFHAFRSSKIQIEKDNEFSGIKIYIDNMFLCDERELLQNLENYGLLTHTSNEVIQSVRGIGAMIYIIDKVNISANARRTFIEVTDMSSLEFMQILAEFVNTIYDTRYALSRYASAKGKKKVDEQKLNNLREEALSNLKKLAKEKIELPLDDEKEDLPIRNTAVQNDETTQIELKRKAKQIISRNLDQDVNKYIKETDNLDIDNAYLDFIEWFKLNK